MAYSGSILAAILPQRYEKEIIQRNNLAKIEKIQRNNSAVSSLFAICHTIRHISVLFIPEIWKVKQYLVPLQCNFARIV